MIKHGKVHPFSAKGRPNTHLAPIRSFVTKGVADAKENVILQPQACDVKGAKRFDGQRCVIAKTLKRMLKPQAVAVGRSLAFVVIDGLAIRFMLPEASRQLVEEFDQRGRARNAPFTLNAPHASWRLGNPRAQGDSKKTTSRPPHKRTKQIGVRAVGGGIAAR